jgi:hypothetical protein
VLIPHKGKIEIPLDKLGFWICNRGEGIKEALKYLGNVDQIGTYYRTARIRKSARICRWVVELVAKILSAPGRKLLIEFENSTMLCTLRVITGGYWPIVQVSIVSVRGGVQ